MQADAYRRARKLLSSRRDYVIARVLGFVQSLLIVALLGVIALVRGAGVLARRSSVPVDQVELAAGLGGQPRDRRRPAISAVRRYGDLSADRGQPAEQKSGPSTPARRSWAGRRAASRRFDTTAARSRPCSPLGSICVVLDRSGGDLAATCRGRGRDRRRDVAAPADSPPDVPAGPVIAADRGYRPGHQLVDSRGQRHPRRPDRRPRPDPADSGPGGRPAGDRAPGLAAAWPPSWRRWVCSSG